MPRTTLNSLLATPTCDLNILCEQNGCDRLYFIFDPSVHPEALARLYALGVPFEPTALLGEANLGAKTSHGMFGFEAIPGNELSNAAATLCLDTGCGILAAGAHPATALSQARSLLRAKDACGGESLLSIGNPQVWVALALSVSSTAPRLYGALPVVLSPPPRRLGIAEGWYQWQRPAGSMASDPLAPLQLPADFHTVSKTVRLIWWLDQHHLMFGEPVAAEVPHLVSNLETLIDHDVVEARHLLELAQVAKGPALAMNPQAMAILREPEEGFMKVKHLAGLFESLDPLHTQSPRMEAR